MTAAYWAQFPPEDDIIIDDNIDDTEDAYSDLDKDLDDFYENQPYCWACRDHGCSSCL